MQAVVPTLQIREYARSRRFYVDGMGFRIDWEWRPQPDATRRVAKNSWWTSHKR